MTEHSCTLCGIPRPPKIGYLIVAPADHIGKRVRYSGVRRLQPCQVLDVNEGTPAEKIWQQEVEQLQPEDAKWHSMFSCLESALCFRNRYAALGVEFDVIGVHLCEQYSDYERVCHRDAYIGLDVGGLNADSQIEAIILGDCVSEYSTCQLSVVWRLRELYFLPRLNRYGLLVAFEDAILLRDLSRWLAVIAPEEHEPEYFHVEVFAVTSEYQSVTV